MFLFNLVNIDFASRDKLIDEIIVANDIFSVWYESRCDFELQIKNKTSYDALLGFRFFILYILCICDAGK